MDPKRDVVEGSEIQPKEASEAREINDFSQQRFRILHLFILLCLIPILVIFILANWMFVPEALLDLAFYSSIPIAATYLIGKRSGSPVLAGNWIFLTCFLCFFIAAFFTGRLDSPALLLATAIPILATQICGKGYGILWGGAVFLMIAMFFFIGPNGYGIEEHFDQNSALDGYYAAMIGMVFVTLFLSLASEYLRERYVSRLERTYHDLRITLENIHTLKGLLPVCVKCRKIRNDNGYWENIENYVKTHLDVELTHGICPDCYSKVLEGPAQ